MVPPSKKKRERPELAYIVVEVTGGYIKGCIALQLLIYNLTKRNKGLRDA
jgi:hypothetical protein